MNITINDAIEIAGRTAAALCATMPTKIIALVISFLICIAGYRLMRGTSALIGLLTGVAVGAVISGILPVQTSEWMALILTIAVVVICAMVGAALGLQFYCVGIFILCAAIGAGVGYIPATFVWEYSHNAFWIVLGACALLFGITGVLFARPVGIVLTSCFGFLAAIPLSSLLTLWIDPLSNFMTAALGAGLTVLGLIIQIVSNRRDKLPIGVTVRLKQPKPSGQSKPNEEEISDEKQPDLDGTQVIDVERLTEEEEIDSISDVVAAQINMTEPMTEPFREEILDEKPEAAAFVSDAPEQTEDSTMILHLQGDISPIQQEQVQETKAETAIELEDIPQGEQPEDEDPAKFAWMDESPVVPQAEIKTERLLEDETVFRTELLSEQREQPEETEEISEPEQPEETEETSEPEQPEETEETSEPEQPEETEETSEPEQPEEIEAEPELEFEPEPKHRYGIRVIFPIALLVITVGFAAFGIQLVEAAFLLLFICYLLRYYRVAAFAAIVLCLRRIVDSLPVLHSGDWQTIALNGVSAIVFLIAAVITIWTADHEK